MEGHEDEVIIDRHNKSLGSSSPNTGGIQRNSERIHIPANVNWGYAAELKKKPNVWRFRSDEEAQDEWEKVNAYGGGELNNAAMYSKSVTARGKYRRKECLGLISKAYENIKKLR
uniref:Uncharacterized protein n=1 Tax=Acrobeloides nanus TaxID=290746 RepID=A0A914DH81_9BILA